MSQNNETAAVLVSQTSPVGVELLSYANAFFCSNEFRDAGHVSENTLLKKALDNDQNNSLPQELLLLTNNGLSNIKKRPFKEC